MDIYDKNYYDYYVYPYLNDIWFSYYIKKDLIESYNILKNQSYYICNILNEEHNSYLHNFCCDIILDIFHFIICDTYDFDKYKNLIENDYIKLINLIKYHNYLQKTLYSIFFSIVYFVAYKKNLLQFYTY